MPSSLKLASADNDCVASLPVIEIPRSCPIITAVMTLFLQILFDVLILALG